MARPWTALVAVVLLLGGLAAPAAAAGPPTVLAQPAPWSAVLSSAQATAGGVIWATLGSGELYTAPTGEAVCGLDLAPHGTGDVHLVAYGPTGTPFDFGSAPGDASMIFGGGGIQPAPTRLAWFEQGSPLVGAGSTYVLDLVLCLQSDLSATAQVLTFPAPALPGGSALAPQL